MRRLAAALALLVLATASAPALAATPKTSVNDLSDEVMCVVCGVPLNVAGGPQADRERAYIQDLVDQGDTKQQIKDELVKTYGEDVLGDDTSGIAVTTWLVPLILVLAALAALAIFVPRWRRNRAAAAAAGASAPAAAPLDEADEQRLEEDLARYR